MSLRSKILLIVFLVITAGVAANYLIERRIIMPRFVELENHKAQMNIDRCLESIEGEIRHLDSFIADWAYWDDTYVFAQDRNQNFIASNLGIVVFKESNLNLLYICDISGHVIWGQVYDHNQQPIQLKEFPADALPLDHLVLSYCNGEKLDDCDGMTGIVMTERYPMLFAAKPILTSQKTGPARGFVIMGRFLDKAMNKKLADQTKVDFTISAIGKSSDAKTDIILKQTAKTKSPYIHQIDENRLKIYTTVADVQGAPAVLLQADLPRDIYQQGLLAMDYTRLSSVLINISVLATLMIWLRVAVIWPLSKLTSHTAKITQNDNLTIRLDMKRCDEIGVLAGSFDFMLERLSKMRTELMERSYKWGKAEMASGVLHNLRGSLSPVVERIDLMREDIEKVPLDTIQAAQRQLSQEETPLELKADLHRFLELAGGDLESLCRKMKTELEDLTGQAKQIERMLGAQDILSHSSDTTEPAKTSALPEK
jgi:sensor domain CHASE-containing protein